MLTIFLLETSVLDGILPPWSFGPGRWVRKAKAAQFTWTDPLSLTLMGQADEETTLVTSNARQSASRLLLPKKKWYIL
jgi:hypothetical protein